MGVAAQVKRPSRRVVVAAPCAAGLAALLAGCATNDASGGLPAAPPASPADPGAADPAEPARTAGGRPDGAAPLARVSDIPVGGGKIFADRGVVITQPTAGTIKAFSAACTHQGCTVARVRTTIDCLCHGSRFDIADGSVVAGPAPRGLPPVAVRVSGGTITLA